MLARYYNTNLARFLAADPGDDTDLGSPQSWNHYSYVRNNPISAVDPTGQAAFAVFDAFACSDLPDGRPNWAAIKAAAVANGHTVQLYSGSTATPANYNAAIGTSGMNVIDVSHTLEHGSPTPNTEGLLLTGGGVGNPNITVPDGQPMVAPGAIKADSVSAFGCESAGLAGQYGGTKFTGVDSGGDQSNSQTLESAAAAFLSSATSGPASKPVNLNAAASAAQSVFSSSTRQTPGDPGTTPKNIDTNDRVVQRP